MQQDRELDVLPAQKSARLKRRRQTSEKTPMDSTTTLKQHKQQTFPSPITARMPIHALTTKWTLGDNRLLIPHHVQVLKQRFLDKGGPKREAKENYLQVLCSGADLTRMIEKVGLGETDWYAAGAIPDFQDWMSVNSGRKAEVLAGQHRIKAFEEFATQVGLGKDDLWWPCEIYNKGKM
jgi:hypothetical protein